MTAEQRDSLPLETVLCCSWYKKKTIWTCFCEPSMYPPNWLVYQGRSRNKGEATFLQAPQSLPSKNIQAVGKYQKLSEVKASSLFELHLLLWACNSFFLTAWIKQQQHPLALWASPYRERVKSVAFYRFDTAAGHELIRLYKWSLPQLGQTLQTDETSQSHTL